MIRYADCLFNFRRHATAGNVQYTEIVCGRSLLQFTASLSLRSAAFGWEKPLDTEEELMKLRAVQASFYGPWRSLFCGWETETSISAKAYNSETVRLEAAAF